MAKSPSENILNSSHIIIPSDWQTDSSICHISRCGWCAYVHDFMNHICLSLFQDYIDAHPETIILDPLPAIRTLLDRCKSYQLIHRLESCMKGASPSPGFLFGLNDKGSVDCLDVTSCLSVHNILNRLRCLPFLRMRGSTWITCDSPVAPHLNYFTLCFRAEQQMFGFSPPSLFSNKNTYLLSPAWTCLTVFQLTRTRLRPVSQLPTPSVNESVGCAFWWEADEPGDESGAFPAHTP